MGITVLSMDVMGLDLYKALAMGKLSAEVVTVALEGHNPVGSDAAATIAEVRRALLPYPIWRALGGDSIRSSAGWQLEPGPANSRDLVAFIERGELITEEMKQPHTLADERLAAVLPHGLLALLFAVAPLSWVGLPTLLVGIGTVLATTCLLAGLWPRLPSRGKGIKGAIAGTAVGGITFAALGIIGGGTENLLALIALPLIGAWLSFLAGPHIQPSA
jgi:hypothetical protein